MNRLKTEKQTRVLSDLIEGVSINIKCLMTGVAKHTVLKLLEDKGCACASYHHRHVCGLRPRRIPCDEIWQFAGAKAKNAPEQKAAGWGDAWIWVDCNRKKWIAHPSRSAMCVFNRSVTEQTLLGGWTGI